MRRHTDRWALSLRDEEYGDNNDNADNGDKEEKKKVGGLTRIVLRENRIGDKGAIALASALKMDMWITGTVPSLFDFFCIF